MALKPMNCPAHIQIFKQGTKSYRDLPLRLAEFGFAVTERGAWRPARLMRVRQMTQDDAHIFCTEDQINRKQKPSARCSIRSMRTWGSRMCGSCWQRGPMPGPGPMKSGDLAEKALGDALRATGRDFKIAPGDGAFYGPKLEFHLKDAIGRSWQLGRCNSTSCCRNGLMHLMSLPTGIASVRSCCTAPIFGSLERFIGVIWKAMPGNFRSGWPRAGGGGVHRLGRR